jgi:NAD(P)-dependent dehydrogenase (short-subunit alcohol dehydrogenase family)
VSDFSGRTVLITGAAGGIGAATARTITAAGGGVVLHDLRREGALAGLAAELGDAATTITADLSRPSAADEVWAQAVAWRGRVDALINNAGIYEPAVVDGPFDAWEAAWHRTLAICLVTPAALCRAAIASFAAQDGGGVIVSLASRAAWRGEDPDYWHYAAAKAGIVAMTKTIARQYGRQGVTAFAVAPGFVDTPFNAPLVAEHGMDMFIRDTGLGEVAQPQDIANVIAFLASGKARHATGTTVDVNSASYVR